MELGRHLVRELGIEERVDTLGRWMAHHLSELIDRAENAPSDTERAIALEEATYTILKLWEYRASLPGNAYPLAPYKNILLALDRLGANNPSFIESWGHTSTERVRLALSINRGMSYLFMSVLLLEEGLTTTEDLHSTAPVAVEALTQEEQLVIDSIEHWIHLFWPKADSPTIEQVTLDAAPQPEIDFGHMVLELIDEMITDLTELRGHITSNSDQQ